MKKFAKKVSIIRTILSDTDKIYTDDDNKVLKKQQL